MVADLRKMQENQGVSENQIDKQRFGAGILNIGYENQQSMAEKAPQIGYVGTFRIRPSRSMKKTIFLYRFFELFLRYFT